MSQPKRATNPPLMAFALTLYGLQLQYPQIPKAANAWGIRFRYDQAEVARVRGELGTMLVMLARSPTYAAATWVFDVLGHALQLYRGPLFKQP